jgi:CTP synthase (UTP-ammonia lyase)
VVRPLSCALPGEKSAVRIMPGSRACSLYGREEAIEELWCSYGFDATDGEAMTSAGFAVRGVDAAGEARIVESLTHPFFVATPFLPLNQSEPGRPHPILRGFAELVNSSPARR